jgi:Fe-S-cluster containining protein
MHSILAPDTAPACRPGCGACCIAPSISTPIPAPDGRPAAPKPAGQRCMQLDDGLRCRLFGHPARPVVCASLRPAGEMCGQSPAQAMQWLARMESDTQPA